MKTPEAAEMVMLPTIQELAKQWNALGPSAFMESPYAGILRRIVPLEQAGAWMEGVNKKYNAGFDLTNVAP